MGFVKIQKTKAYFKRFQVKYRRRREGKTDYYARKRLVAQDRNKYNSPKYRLVVRFTNKEVICQVVYSKIVGDIVLCAAYSHELPKFGVASGLKNWSAAYCTGLLCARRLLTKMKLADKYEGQAEPDGEEYHVEEEDDAPRPFSCALDAGLVRTTTGNRVFGALKGAVDGGLDIPHSVKRFPGYDREAKEYDAEQCKHYIFGGHLSDYMTMMEEEDPDKYKEHFAQFVAADIDADAIEEMYQTAHAKIRADPTYTCTKKDKKYPSHHEKKQTFADRKAKAAKTKAAIDAAHAAGGDDDDDE